MKELKKQVEEYVDNKDAYILNRAIVNEVFYQYECLKDEDYDEVKDLELTFNDILEISNNVLNTYHMNDGFSEVIDTWLFRYIDGNK